MNGLPDIRAVIRICNHGGEFPAPRTGWGQLTRSAGVKLYAATSSPMTIKGGGNWEGIRQFAVFRGWVVAIGSKLQATIEMPHLWRGNA